MRRSLAVAMTVAVGGCAPAAQARAGDTAREFAAHLAAGRTEQACALLAPDAAKRLDSCPESLPGLVEPGEVGSVDVWGDGAIVAVGPHRMFLHQFAGGWRVTGAGCQDRGDRPYECAVGGP